MSLRFSWWLFSSVAIVHARLGFSFTVVTCSLFESYVGLLFISMVVYFVSNFSFDGRKFSSRCHQMSGEFVSTFPSAPTVMNVSEKEWSDSAKSTLTTSSS